MTPFRRLLALFQARFFENDTASPGGSFETNIYQMMGLLATPGLFVSYLFMPHFLPLATRHLDHAGLWALRLFRLFYPAFSFALVGFVSFFEWDKLFPDRRDFLILSSFPIPLRSILAAKISALFLFLLMLIGAVNFFPNLVAPLLSIAIPEVRKAGYVHVAAAQIGSTAGSSMFAFLAVVAFQGVLINITTPRFFRRISPWIQAAGMSLMILSLLLYPLYSVLLPSAAKARAQWLWLFPPVWFTGWYDLLLNPHDALFSSLGQYGLKMLAAVAGLFWLTWWLAFRRHYRRTLEAEDTGQRKPSRNLFNWLRAPTTALVEEQSIFQFTGKILARSSTHRVFLASYWSVGIAVGLLTTVIIRNGQLTLSPAGLRGFPFLILFFIASGFRAAYQFPAELSANWLFQITEQRWTEIARKAARNRVLASGLIPAILIMSPFEIAYWGPANGVFHTLLQLLSGVLLVELLFWNFDKVPFTCSYFPGRIRLALLAGIYVYGFTAYSSEMADSEAAIEEHPLYGIVFLALAIATLVVIRRRNPVASAVRFDGSEPDIQALDLT